MTVLVNNTSEHQKELLSGLLHGYLHGECYAFAVALHRALGWTLILLTDSRSPVHVVVQNPKTQIFHDARGIVPAEKLSDPFSITPPCTLRALSEAELQQMLPIQEASIQKAMEIAEIVWPEYPWQDTTVNRARRFAQALETLCKEHGFWLRASVPASPPILYPSYGDEQGFALTPTGIGQSFTLDRIL
jgi:hypothetical protein